LMGLRLELKQTSALVIALAWLLAQAAQASVGWGRNTRLFALADLSTADAAFKPPPRRLPTPLVVEALTVEPVELAPLSKGQGPAI
jgi:hypothetical protein